MRFWDLPAMHVAPHHPEVLPEAAWLVVASGRVALRAAAGDEREAGVGFLASLDPAERHEVRPLEDSRLLLLLTPWPAPDRTPGVDA